MFFRRISAPIPPSAFLWISNSPLFKLAENHLFAVLRFLKFEPPPRFKAKEILMSKSLDLTIFSPATLLHTPSRKDDLLCPSLIIHHHLSAYQSGSLLHDEVDDFLKAISGWHKSHRALNDTEIHHMRENSKCMSVLIILLASNVAALH